MIHVLRLGHRIGRDSRISTHCGLVSRALGCERILYTGERDRGMEGSIRRVARQWGGGFGIAHRKDHRKTMAEYRQKGFIIVHLTVYGIPIQERIRALREKRKILVVVGGEKVPTDVYRLSDFNISVTGQPHSEISALSIFLHEYFRGKELCRRFPNARIRVVPQERGKKTMK